MAVVHAEMDCKCCGFNNVVPEWLELINEAQQITEDLCGYYVVFKVNSGCRCPAHNEASGGSERSAHLDGWAVDLAVNSSRERMMMIRAFTSLGVSRVGVGRGFLHFDKHPDKVPDVMWTYGNGSLK